jgi:hypothetical protein
LVALIGRAENLILKRNSTTAPKDKERANVQQFYSILN